MSIKRDSGELLLYSYKRYNENSFKPLTEEDLEKETRWDIHRIRRAMIYLRDEKLLEVQSSLLSPDFDLRIIRPTPQGINIIENERKFLKNFQFTANLGIFSFSWGANEK